MKYNLCFFFFNKFDVRYFFRTRITSMTNNNRNLGLLPSRLISDYSKPVQIWRKMSTPSAQALQHDRWIMDFWETADEEESLLEWLSDRLILGPPRPRSLQELSLMYEDYLLPHEFHRHFIPWMKTWPHSENHSWCTGPYHTTLPHWVYNHWHASNGDVTTS